MRFEADIGAFALLEEGEAAVVALRTGLFRLNFATGETAFLASPPFDRDASVSTKACATARAASGSASCSTPSRESE
jgi:hypothetical protein